MPLHIPSVMRGRGYDDNRSNTRKHSFSCQPQPPHRHFISHIRRRTLSDKRSNRSLTPPPDLDDYMPSNIAADVDAIHEAQDEEIGGRNKIKGNEINDTGDYNEAEEVESILRKSQRTTVEDADENDATVSPVAAVQMDEVLIPFTAVTTSFGLYEWLVMPQGMKNSPSVHQRRVNNALCDYLGKFCHIYLDNIIISSDTIEQHTKHIRLIMDALRIHQLYCNQKKSKFYLYEVEFLGHQILRHGIEPDNSKVAHIVEWPKPNSPGDIQKFLGLTQYLASFLPKLAEQTAVLNKLTDLKDHQWPGWSDTHHKAFLAIKNLMLLADCLTVINHDNPGDNKIWVTCDASNVWTCTVLSFGTTWETAHLWLTTRYS